MLARAEERTEYRITRVFPKAKQERQAPAHVKRELKFTEISDAGAATRLASLTWARSSLSSSREHLEPRRDRALQPERGSAGAWADDLRLPAGAAALPAAARVLSAAAGTPQPLFLFPFVWAGI